MLDMVMGSRAYTAAARSVWVLMEDGDRHLLSCAGSNFEKEKTTLPCDWTDYSRPDGQGKSIKFTWFDCEQSSADDIKRQLVSSRLDKTAPKLKAAIEFLRGKLKEGPVEATVIIEAAKNVNPPIAVDTLRRAAKQICTAPYKEAPDKPYYWKLLGQ